MATEVSYICKRTVVSTKAVEPGRFFPLSVLDHHMEKNHIRMVYYYQTSREVEVGGVTKKLRESLSEMLTHFPIVSGRLVRDDERGHWKIKCNDAGVRMVEAKAKGSVEGWLTNLDREKELQLVHWEEMFHKPYYWSTFYVQLTEFEEGGLAIGLSCIHLLADSTCATTFMKAWADISLCNKMITPPLFHPLPPPRPRNRNPNHHPHMELIHHYKSLIEKPIALKDVRYTTISLGFSDHMVQACMSMVQPNGPITPFEALTTLFWVSLSKIKGLGNGLVDMSICLDMRKVLGLDYGFFGNCMVYNKVHVEGNKFPQVVKAISDVVTKMNSEGIMDLIEWLENNDTSSLTMMNGHDLVCASLEGVDPYLAVFQDWFKPIHVSYYVEPVLGEGQVLILPGKQGEGPLSRVAMVTLREEEAIKLCEDDVISQFSPSILMKCQ
ncbi:protein ECERIFERUM 2 [Cajanus cajan]|uniref:3'-N-debenzoyl-2'-deoxytaxol N-benzoyltransferase n=1 Tax=Cajanus cajan TaxID=3821 RepID=A0A151TZK7_CAJCA|nr:protein ECERIFERUM 2 [Cajanus cajan]KYP72451.1 3'-N-debenzoyl-2'-deoxytaxol N-benzoyltransferase [Cajanus cajan]